MPIPSTTFYYSSNLPPEENLAKLDQEKCKIPVG